MRAWDQVYPEIEPFRTHRLAVDPPHELYVEEVGAPDGLPAVFLHGGPGGGAKPFQRRTFDPGRFRVVLFDQRGCGRSTPSAELGGNNTDALIADIERVRMHLGIDKWLVTGGSWGSFLSLAYAIAHPERCLGLRLHGVFLGSPGEVRHWFKGIGLLFPEAHEAFAGHIPEAERGDLLAAYFRRLTDPDPAVHGPVAEALRSYSAQTQTLVPSPAHIAALTEPKAALEISRIFTHFCTNGFFRPDGFLLENVGRIRHLPCEIVQGRYDVVTPPTAAYRLAKAWPEAAFQIVDRANHVATDDAPDLALAMADATDRLADKLAPGMPSLNAFFDAPMDGMAAVSSDGTLLAYVSDETGIGQIWTKTLPDGEPALRLATAERVTGLSMRPGGRDLLFTTDAGGDERHQIWLLEDGAAEARALLQDPRFVHNWGAFDPEGSRIAWSSNAREPASMDVHLLDLASGAQRTLLEARGWRTPKAFTPDGRSLLVEDNTEGMKTPGLLLIDLESGAVRTLLNAEEGEIAALRVAPDGRTLYLATSRGREFVGLAALDLESGDMRWISTPDGDVEQIALHRASGRLALAVNRRGVSSLIELDPEAGSETPRESPTRESPTGRILSLAYRPDGALTATIASFTAPNRIYTLPAEGPASPMVERPALGAARAPDEVLISADDGVEIPAFFWEGSGPALVWIHGGPESQFAANWRADLQYLISRGWSVLAPNIRGSSGYGRTWMAADDREKRPRAVADVKAVRDWMAARDPKGLAVGGQSYGGYMTLATLTEHPDDWDAGCDIFGFVDFCRQLETTAHYRRKLRAVEYGDPTDPADRPWLDALSPIHKLDDMKAPLFIAHGLEDPRVPPSESEVVSTVLRGRGHPHEILRIPGEGHGFQHRANRKKVFGRMTGFLISHLGGA
ncbi:MAG: prolyl aminopeptidase [Pseudomonadota bacterium]